MLKEIYHHEKKLAEDKVIKLAQQLEANKNTYKIFQVQKLFRRSNYKPFHLIDDDHKISSNPLHVEPQITQFYRNFFNPTGQLEVLPFDRGPEPLATPITPAEVQHAIQRLTNGKASGKDGIVAELYKYGGIEIAQAMAVEFNKMFEQTH